MLHYENCFAETMVAREEQLNSLTATSDSTRCCCPSIDRLFLLFSRSKVRIDVCEAFKLVALHVLDDALISRSQSGFGIGEHRIEIFGQSWIAYAWNERSLDFLTFQSCPMQSTEKAVSAHILFTAGSTAEPMFRRFGKKTFASVFRFFGQPLWIADLLFGDGRKQFFFIFSVCFLTIKSANSKR